ncbi:MAG: tetratricopeptide repeat protein [Candidatus Moranbacteria bacterium]|nr:tetratricopeptide repeat protein [Candidatus Moranbacteria bacterium]
MDKNKQILKSEKLSLKKLSEDSRLIKRGLRDLNVWPKIEDIFNKLEEKYQVGLTDFAPDVIEECFQLCEEILKTDPNHFLTLCYYARCLYHKGHYNESLRYLTRCLNEENDHFHLWKFKGDCYYKMKKYEEALDDYKKSFELDPTNGPTIDDIAQCFFLLGNLENAHNYIDRLILLENESDMPMIRKAQFFEFQRDTKGAIGQYQKTLAKFPDSEYAIKKLKELI